MVLRILNELLMSPAFTAKRRAFEPFTIKSGTVGDEFFRPGVEVGTIVLRVDWENNDYAEWHFQQRLDVPEGQASGFIGVRMLSHEYSWEEKAG